MGQAQVHPEITPLIICGPSGVGKGKQNSQKHTQNLTVLQLKQENKMIQKKKKLTQGL